MRCAMAMADDPTKLCGRFAGFLSPVGSSGQIPG